MKSFNHVMLIGHLAAEVDFRQTKSGISVANFPVAVNRITKDADGTKNEVVDFHRIVAFGGLAGICNEYLDKGVAVCVCGRLINRSFEDSQKNKHYRTEIIADDLNILTWKRGKNADKNIEIKEVNVAEQCEEVV